MKILLILFTLFYPQVDTLPTGSGRFTRGLIVYDNRKPIGAFSILGRVHGKPATKFPSVQGLIIQGRDTFAVIFK